MDRALSLLREVALACTRCPLAEHRTQVVFGEGPSAARLLVVGEAPGIEEDASGHPFRGRAGRALNAALAATGIDREDVFVTNAAMCLPTRRPAPTPAEVDACAPFLDLQLAVVRPAVVVTLGLVPTRRLLGVAAPLESLRGKVHKRSGISVVPTWHPAAWNRVVGRRADALADLALARLELGSAELFGRLS